MKIDLKQKSTQTGLLLAGSAIAAAVGHPEILTMDPLSGSAAGLLPVIISACVGLWDMFRHEHSAADPQALPGLDEND